jgi:predicted secreted hydrolase
LVSIARWLVLAAAALCANVGALANDAARQVEYPPVTAGHRIEFPRDEGSHPQFRTEWWYVTGWLEREGEGPLGFQITFFRTRPGNDEDNPSRFAARQLLFAHLAISDPARGVLLRDQKSAREGFGLAAAAEGTVDVHIDDWFMRKEGERYHVVAAAQRFGIDLEFVSTQPPLLQGEEGFSQKGPHPSSASYYYSLPQLQTSGRVMIDGRAYAVRGKAWFDHEWASEIMDQAAHGWDWIGLNLDDGGALMSLRMRDAQGRQYWAAATWRTGPAAGEVRTTYSAQQIEWQPLRYWLSPRTGVRYPVEWRVTIGGRTLLLRPMFDDQENDTRDSTGTIYWEGAVRAFDESGRPIGRGYLELTGYDARVAF